MAKENGDLVSVKIIPNEQDRPPGKLADAEVIFEAGAGPLSGLPLIGFAVWERRDGGKNVRFPARQYSVSGERRSFALLRSANGVVTGGALSRDGTRWLPARRRYLFPVRALAQVLRAKYLEVLDGAYRAHRLTFAGGTAPLVVSVAWRGFLATPYAQSWVVYAKPPFGGPDRVLAYLARYTHRVAITHTRLVDLVDGVVRFRWKDYADHDHQKIMALPAQEFLRRFLLHVLPVRFVRIRHAGLFGNHHRHARLARCRALLGVSRLPAPAEPAAAHLPPAPERCPVCQQGTMHVTAVFVPVVDAPRGPRAPDPP